MEDLKEQVKVAVDAFKSNKIKEAEIITTKLINKNPKIVFLYNLLGLILVQQQKFDKALECYNKGVEVDPTFAMIYNNLGLLFAHHKNDNLKAENFYKKSISLNQNIPEPFNNLASLYKSRDRYVEAIDCYKKAIDIKPDFVHAFHNLGNLYTTMGRFNEAKKAFMKAIEIDPSYSISHRTLSRLIKYKEDDEHFLKLKKAYNKINTNIKTSDKSNLGFATDPSNSERYGDINSLNKINLAFALGKAYEDIKDFKKSFEFYNEANNLYNRKSNFLLSAQKDSFKKIKGTFHKDLYKKYNNTGSMNSSPIFILGMPRSGTTLIEQILSSHPEVFGGDEQVFIPNLLHKNFGNKDLKLFFENVIPFKKENFKTIGEDYIYRMQEISKNSKRFTDKFPENFFWIGFIKLILPNSKIIHSYRNSRDTCFSLFKNHFPIGRMDYTYDINMIVEYYNLYSDLMNYWNQVLPNFIFNIKYENLIANTENEVRKLLKFTELTWNDKCMNFQDNKRAVKTASDVQARSKIYSTSINSWMNYKEFLDKPFAKLKN